MAWDEIHPLLQAVSYFRVYVSHYVRNQSIQELSFRISRLSVIYDPPRQRSFSRRRDSESVDRQSFENPEKQGLTKGITKVSLEMKGLARRQIAETVDRQKI